MGVRGRKGMCKIEKCWCRRWYSWLDACNFPFDLCELCFVCIKGQGRSF
jgi:hypothetical protein